MNHAKQNLLNIFKFVEQKRRIIRTLTERIEAPNEIDSMNSTQAFKISSV